MKKIVIIEDSSSVAALIKSVLESEGYSVLVSEDGEQGVQTATSDSPDLVITDRNLPGIDGLEVCKQLKEKCKKVPKILVMTGTVNESDEKKAYESGADGFIKKAGDFDAILAKVKELLKEG